MQSTNYEGARAPDFKAGRSGVREGELGGEAEQTDIYDLLPKQPYSLRVGADGAGRSGSMAPQLRGRGRATRCRYGPAPAGYLLPARAWQKDGGVDATVS